MMMMMLLVSPHFQVLNVNCKKSFLVKTLSFFFVAG